MIEHRSAPGRILPLNADVDGGQMCALKVDGFADIKDLCALVLEVSVSSSDSAFSDTDKVSSKFGRSLRFKIAS